MKYVLLTMLLVLAGCQSAVDSAYYSAMEKVGWEKRDILVDRVEDAKESQEEAQQQFSSALEHFSQLVNFDGGELQDVYEELTDNYDASKDSAERVTTRIDSVESVANALFDEWQRELGEYSSEKLRRDMTLKMKDTQRRYDKLLAAMRKAEAKMQPVLAALKDNTLYLKHNLNASAIGSLQGEFSNIKGDIDALIKEMNAAIAQSNEFISTLKG